jgi:hypothetical protein
MIFFSSVILSEGAAEVEGSAPGALCRSRKSFFLKSKVFRGLILRQAQDDGFLK